MMQRLLADEDIQLGRPSILHRLIFTKTSELQRRRSEVRLTTSRHDRCSPRSDEAMIKEFAGHA